MGRNVEFSATIRQNMAIPVTTTFCNYIYNVSSFLYCFDMEFIRFLFYKNFITNIILKSICICIPNKIIIYDGHSLLSDSPDNWLCSSLHFVCFQTHKYCNDRKRINKRASLLEQSRIHFIIWYFSLMWSYTHVPCQVVRWAPKALKLKHVSSLCCHELDFFKIAMSLAVKIKKKEQSHMHFTER